MDINIESEIKSYFFLRKTSGSRMISVPKRQFLTGLEKYNVNPRFYNICKQLIRKQYEKPPQGKRLTNIVYNQELHRFSESLLLKKPFVEYTPGNTAKKVVSGLLGHVYSKGSMSIQHVRIVHQLLSRFPLLTPHVLSYPLEGKTFLDRTIEAAFESELELQPIMFFLCMNCPVVVQL